MYVNVGSRALIISKWAVCGRDLRPLVGSVIFVGGVSDFHKVEWDMGVMWVGMG